MSIGFISKDFYNGLFDNNTALNLRKLEGDGLVSELKGPFGSGKEALVFYTRSLDNLECAVKIHRYSINPFKKIPQYMRIRRKKVVNNLSIINVWTSYEYKYLLKSYNLGIKVPKPYRQYKNIIVMKFLGYNGIPAPLLNEINDFDKERVYSILLDSIKKMAKAGYTHGDLSAYNIMYFEDEPYIIDFSQSVKITPSTKDYLIKDINNLNAFFKEIKTEPVEKILKEVGLFE
ncbi:MAG: RIO1 family regulatory kinase/ATPase [Candidatus Rehaiarchaeum fermentans]|nr:serine protein kinase RIO [Candidatus Rehaiarchaeum fermentans]